MANKVDVRNFLFNTDYDMDKIVYFFEGKIKFNDSVYQKDIDLNFLPMTFGVWSESEDFEVCYSFGNGIVGSWFSGGNEKNVELSAQNEWDVGEDKIIRRYLNFFDAVGNLNEIWVRVYGLCPSDEFKKASNTSNNGKEFVLNTDYNYRKVYRSGIISLGSLENSVEFEHNLGYIPQVMCWSEELFNGKSMDIMLEGRYMIGYKFDGVDNGPYGTEITDKKLIFRRMPNIVPNEMKLHYRIYFDEAE